MSQLSIYHPCIHEISKRYSDLDSQVRRGSLRVDDAISRYASVIKEGTLGMAKLGSSIPSEADDSDMSIPFVVTTLQEDRDGDVVIPMGCQLGNYKLNPICYFGHQQYQNLPFPIAKCVAPDGRITVYPEENLIRVRMYFDRNDPDAVKIYQKVRDGFLNATSIAFVPIEAYRRDREAEKGLYEQRAHTHSSPMTPAGWIFKQYDLTEISVVGVPANAGAIRDWMDTDKELSDRVQKYLLPYAAKALGRSFSGWCPPGTTACPDGTCRPVTKSHGNSAADAGDTEPDAEDDEVPTWDAIVDGKAWRSVQAPDADTAQSIVTWEIDAVRRKEMPHGYTECEFRERFPRPKVEVKGPYRLSKRTAPKAVAKAWDYEATEMAYFGEPLALDQSPPPERWNKSLSDAFDAMPELQMEDAEKVGAATTHRVAAKYLACQIKDLHQSSVMVPSPRMGSFLSGLKKVLGEYRCVEIRNIGDRSEQPPVYETIRLNSKSRDNFLVQGTMFMESVAPRGKRANPRQVAKISKGSGPHNHYGAGIGDRRFIVKFRPEWGGLNVTVITTRKDAALNQDVTDRAWAWAHANNYLKGEAFALSGEFLERTGEGWDDVFLEERNKRAVQRTLDLFNAKGKEFANRGVILTGPPGTGKTLSGRIIRNHAKGTFIWVSSRDFHASGSVGGLRGAFEMAKELAPAIVFMEDVDNWLHPTTIDLLKTEMDGISRSKGVLTILTTNFPEQLPEALIDRPGRFHDVLNFDLPTEDARRAMLAKWLPVEKGWASQAMAAGKNARAASKEAYELDEDSAQAKAAWAASQATNFDPKPIQAREMANKHAQAEKLHLAARDHYQQEARSDQAGAQWLNTVAREHQLAANKHGNAADEWTKPVLRSLDIAVEKSAGYSGAHVYELAHFAKTLSEQDGLAPAEAVREALAKVESQRELITRLQLSGSNYDPLRNSRRQRKGEQTPMRMAKGLGLIGKDASNRMRQGDASQLSEQASAYKQRGLPYDKWHKLAEERSLATTRKPLSSFPADLAKIHASGASPQEGVLAAANAGKPGSPYGKSICARKRGGQCNCKKQEISAVEKSVQKVEPLLPQGRSRGGDVRLEPRNIEPIRQHLIDDTFRGDRTVEQLPEFNKWLDAVRTHYMELHTIQDRQRHRRELEGAYKALIQSYERTTGKKARSLAEALAALPSDMKSLRKAQPSSGIDPAKACKILEDGTINGKPLTEAQRGMFGAACGRKGIRNYFAKGPVRKEWLEAMEVGSKYVIVYENKNPIRYYVNSQFEMNQDHHLAGPFQTEQQALDWCSSHKSLRKQALAENSGPAGGYTVPVDSTLDDATVADTKTICVECGGSGECSGCDGAGTVGGNETKPCELCGGSGECAMCVGSGMTTQTIAG